MPSQHTGEITGITKSYAAANKCHYLNAAFCSAFVVVSWIYAFWQALAGVFVWQPAPVAVITCFC